MAKTKIDPIEQRRERISKTIAKLEAPENQKWPKSFKTPLKYDNWVETKEIKLRELREEYIMLDAADQYNEIPLAILASELGIRLDDAVMIVREHLLTPSFQGKYIEGWRVTRDELARLIAIGGDELVRLTNQSEEEMFEDGLTAIVEEDTGQLQCVLDRLDRHYESYPLWCALNIGLEFLEDRVHDLLSSLTVAGGGREETLMTLLPALRRVASVVQPKSHMAGVMRERVIALVDGSKPKRFYDTYPRHGTSEFFSAMDENQRHAMLLSNVVLESIKKYKFNKWLRDRREWKDEEQVERVIRNAIYTALEAEDSYYDSDSSRLFVDKFVEMFPKRWIPAEHIEFLPSKSKR